MNITQSSMSKTYAGAENLDGVAVSLQVLKAEGEIVILQVFFREVSTFSKKILKVFKK